VNIKNKSKRIKEFQKVITAHGLGGYVCNETIDQGFLTGYFRNYDDEGILLVTSKGSTIFMKKMLVDQFREIAPHINAVGCRNDEILPLLLKTIKKRKLTAVGFDPAKEKYETGRLWHKNKFRHTGGLVKALREIKNIQELGYLKKSCRIAVRAFDIIKKKIKPGRTERSLALELEYMMKTLGAQEASFPTIVAGGPNTALPHHFTSERKIKNNEVVLLDFGCKYKNYCSDITRTFYLGKRPPALYKKIEAIVKQAHDEAIRAVKPGVRAAFADKTARDIITDAGYGDKFTHGLGHGVGLEVHEPPTVNQASRDILMPGMVFSIEPGIYLYGKFGVRHENLVTVTKTGYKILTR
jgi:Xaa-Pro aminopeptidase